MVCAALLAGAAASATAGLGSAQPAQAQAHQAALQDDKRVLRQELLRLLEHPEPLHTLWTNQRTGHGGRIATSAATVSGTRLCRWYQYTWDRVGESVSGSGQACRERTGAWVLLRGSQVATTRTHTPTEPAPAQGTIGTRSDRILAEPEPRPAQPVARADPPTDPTADTPPQVVDRIVRQVQEHLLRLGYEPGPPDGRVGPKTRAAITAFQRDMGLAPDGFVTNPLVRHLDHAARNTIVGRPADCALPEQVAGPPAGMRLCGRIGD